MKYLDLNGTLWYCQKSHELFLILREIKNKNNVSWNRIYSNDNSRISFGITTDDAWTDIVKNFGYKFIGTIIDFDIASFVESVKNETN